MSNLREGHECAQPDWELSLGGLGGRPGDRSGGIVTRGGGHVEKKRGARIALAGSRDFSSCTMRLGRARVAKLADARDLKSRVLKRTYRFNSDPGHQQQNRSLGSLGISAAGLTTLSVEATCPPTSPREMWLFSIEEIRRLRSLTSPATTPLDGRSTGFSSGSQVRHSYPILDRAGLLAMPIRFD